jgi:hypothetical protein
MMKNLRAVLFPHPYVSEVRLKRVLSLFEKVTLFQPWFLEKATPLAKEWPDLVEVADPGDEFKPKEGFKGLLAEYKQWMRSNYRQGLASIQAFARDGLEADSPTWEIKSMIRNMGRTRGKDETAKALKWHLALHLAEEMGEEQQDTADLLRSVEELGSPLKGAVEEENVAGLPGDLPGLESEHLFSEERLAQILDAWFALFGKKVRGGEALITVNPRVLKFVTDTWDEYAAGGQESRPPEFNLESADLSPLGKQEFLEKRESLFTEDKRRKAVADFFRDPGTGFHAGDLRDRPESYASRVRWTFAYFPSLGEKRIPGRYEFIRQLSGKTVGLMGEAEKDER